MRLIPAFFVITVMHIAWSLALFYVGGGAIMAGFAGSGLMGLVAGLMMAITYFPGMFMSNVVGVRSLGTTGQYAIGLANSVVWGAVGTFVWSLWRDGRRARKGMAQPAPREPPA